MGPAAKAVLDRLGRRRWTCPCRMRRIPFPANSGLGASVRISNPPGMHRDKDGVRDQVCPDEAQLGPRGNGAFDPEALSLPPQSSPAREKGRAAAVTPEAPVFRTAATRSGTARTVGAAAPCRLIRAGQGDATRSQKKSPARSRASKSCCTGSGTGAEAPVPALRIRSRAGRGDGPERPSPASRCAVRKCRC
jgi:hypothetical protein